jgi:hypothetical protein
MMVQVNGADVDGKYPVAQVMAVSAPGVTALDDGVAAGMEQLTALDPHEAHP